MSYKFNFRGIEVTCESVAEMVAAVERLSAVNAKPVSTPPSPIKPPASALSSTGRKEPVAQYVVAAFNLVRDSMPAGATSESFMQALGLDHPKGIGARLSPIRTLLGKYNIEMGDALVSERGADGVRVWKAGPQFEAAFNVLSRIGSDSLL